MQCLPEPCGSWERTLSNRAHASRHTACSPGSFHGWLSIRRLCTADTYCLSVSNGSAWSKSGGKHTQADDFWNQWFQQEKKKENQNHQHELTISIFSPLLYETDIQAVEQCHNQSQANTVQWAISLSCNCLQVANECQSVIFWQGWLAGPWKQAVCKRLSAFLDEVCNLVTDAETTCNPYFP